MYQECQILMMNLLVLKRLLNNTLFIITSDNSGSSGSDGNAANNCPLRGNIRVLIVSLLSGYRQIDVVLN